MMVSIIVSIYNIESYIEKCIRSIIAQTYKDLEIILVCDGPTDRSLSICNEFVNIDSRIKVIEKTNGGLSSARNAGIDFASGDYICFIDGDDYIHPQYIEKLLESIMRSNSDVSVCGADIVDENGKKTGKLATGIKYEEYIPFTKERISAEDVLNRYYKRKNAFFYVVAWNKLYKKEIFSELRYDEGKIYEDEYIFNLWLNKCKIISFVPDKLYYYVQRTGSITSDRKKGERFVYIHEIFQRRYDYYKLYNQMDLLRKESEKYVRLMITFFYYFSKEEKNMYKKNYKRIIGEKLLPLKYIVYYVLIAELSFGKYIKQKVNWRHWDD